MKELSIEEKAKRYDKALERAKKAIKYYDKPCFVKVDEIFPELKESEDERIRKSLISYLHGLGEFEYPNKQTYNNWLTWLEKQGKHPQGKSAVEAAKEEKVDNANKVEQKLTDKIESRFKVGDWIVFNGLILLVNEVVQGYYRTLSVDNLPNSYDYNSINDGARLWNILDAKNGDVLVDNDNNIGIYCHFEGSSWYSYIYLGCDNQLHGFSIGGSHLQNNTKPATKKQRDTLIKAMFDAGYTFDFKKKELKRI